MSSGKMLPASLSSTPLSAADLKLGDWGGGELRIYQNIGLYDVTFQKSAVCGVYVPFYIDRSFSALGLTVISAP